MSSSIVDKYFKKYEYLAKEYASRVKQYQRTGMEYEDILQEMRIKIYMSIVGFAKQWADYRRTGQRKPSPIEFWLRTALSNKVKDFIKKFNQQKVENIDKLSVESDSFDVGTINDMTTKFDYNNLIYLINEVQIIDERWPEVKKKAYMMFVEGHTLQSISNKFKNEGFDAASFISNHNRWLRNNKKQELTEFSNRTFYSYEQEEFSSN